jgi:hypothetical protein
MSDKGKKVTLVILLLVVFVVIGGASTGYIYVGSNQFCGRTCHQMKTREALWRKSSHNRVKCITCHSEPGLMGEIKAHIDGLNYLKSFLKGKTRHITIFATRRNPARLKSCIYCHPAETLIEETETLRVKHVAHIEMDNFLCTDCHEDMIHGTHSFEIEKTRPREEKCIVCHLREGARLNCQSCHVKKVVRGKRHMYVLDALRETGLSKESDF